jgi:hypothetical protein
VTQAVNCIGCSHCHYATAPKDDDDAVARAATVSTRRVLR